MTIFEHDWEHGRTGHRYRIQSIAIDEATLRPVVVYKDTNTAAIWVRPVEEFFDGRFLDTTKT